MCIRISNSARSNHKIRLYTRPEVSSTGDGMFGPASRSRSVVSIGPASSPPAPGARTLEGGSEKLGEVRGGSGSLKGGREVRDATGLLSTTPSDGGGSIAASVTVWARGSDAMCSECSSSSGPPSLSADARVADCDPPSAPLRVATTSGGSSGLCECAMKREDRGSRCPGSGSAVAGSSVSRTCDSAERGVVIVVNSYSSARGRATGGDASSWSVGSPNPW